MCVGRGSETPFCTKSKEKNAKEFKIQANNKKKKRNWAFSKCTKMKCELKLLKLVVEVTVHFIRGLPSLFIVDWGLQIILYFMEPWLEKY